ncbi:hypothetical protein BGZ95_003643, partial [Linnemannia exigua]
SDHVVSGASPGKYSSCLGGGLDHTGSSATATSTMAIATATKIVASPQVLAYGTSSNVWDDILEVFQAHAISVRDGNVPVTPARDFALDLIEPKCIDYEPNKVLDVVIIDRPERTGLFRIPASNQLLKWFESDETPEGLSASSYSACSDETTGSQHFKRLDVRTESDIRGEKSRTPLGHFSKQSGATDTTAIGSTTTTAT